MVDGYKFSTSGLYHTISCDPEAPHKAYMEYIDSLPLNPDPEAFGMHANANITSDQNDTYEMFDLLLSLQVRRNQLQLLPGGLCVVVFWEQKCLWLCV